MESARNSEGFIDLSLLLKEGKAVNAIDSIYIIYIDGKKYFFKPALDEKRDYNELIADKKRVYNELIADKKRVYNELIAEELAKDYGIPCAHYDIAQLDDEKGVISKDVLEDKSYYYVLDLLKEYGKENSGNDLTDIWAALDNKYNNSYIVEKLMKQLTSIFMFDILIANSDRHDDNLIIEDDGRRVSFSPLLDNEGLLSDDAIKYQEYSLSLESGKKTYLKGNLVDKFLNISDSSYTEFLESSLWIISDENINSVLDRVEKRIKAKIPDDEKMNIKEKFKDNRNMIEQAINNKKRRKM